MVRMRMWGRLKKAHNTTAAVRACVCVLHACPRGLAVLAWPSKPAQHIGRPPHAPLTHCRRDGGEGSEGHGDLRREKRRVKWTAAEMIKLSFVFVSAACARRRHTHTHHTHTHAGTLTQRLSGTSVSIARTRRRGEKERGECLFSLFPVGRFAALSARD